MHLVLAADVEVDQPAVAEAAVAREQVSAFTAGAARLLGGVPYGILTRSSRPVLVVPHPHDGA